MRKWPFADPSTASGTSPIHIGGSLDPELILCAYNHGIFPWFNEDQPIKWWCPNPRFVLLPSELRVTDSLKKVMRKKEWKVTIDKDFEGVMRECAAVYRPGQDGTWISEEMIEAYVKLHQMGFAHSVEVYWEDELVGGLYGMALGRVFHGESMFHHKTDASKVGFVALMHRLISCNFSLIDCQVPTPHLESLGAMRVDRNSFLEVIKVQKELKPDGQPWVNPLLISGQRLA
ncbi:MAG: leucyl/phenylalanyl-tRNA--protein transferase [Opitutae bacterium]